MKLREARARKLFSAQQLAIQSGISETNIYRIEKGKWLPSLATVRKLSEVLGMKPEEIQEFQAAIEKSAGRG